MASGANSTPLGRFVPRAPAGAATSSLLKPPATGRASRFSDTPNPLPPAAAAAPPPPVERKSGFSARNFTLVEDGENLRASRFTSKINNGGDDDSQSSFSKFSSHSGDQSREGSREGSAEPAKKKRKSRWAEPSDVRSFIPGMPTIIPSHLTKEQEKAYLLQLQIEDYSKKLRTGDLGIPTNLEERSPSPEPIYNHEGKRLNTRDMRTRRRLEDERHKLIQQMLELNPEYKPPTDYKAPLAKYTDKVLIPQDEHPEINFVGLLIGPRGNTLKQLEKDVGSYVKIIIRGKGSVKEGKLGRGRDPLPGEDEPLHAYITGQSPEAVKGAVERIKRILMEGIEVPEHQNDLRKQQLRELALLNGTLRDEGGPRCSNCGSTAHRTWNCPDKPNITHTIVCNRCGGTGHIAKDCKTDVSQSDPASTVNMDDEYISLMAELGQGGPPPPSKPTPAPPPQRDFSQYQPRPQTSYSAVPPHQQHQPPQQQYGSVPPPPQPGGHHPPAYHPHHPPQHHHPQPYHHQHNSYMQQQHIGYGGAAPPPPPPPTSNGAHMPPPQPGQYGGYYPPPPPPLHYPYGQYGAAWGQPQQQQQPAPQNLPPPPPPPPPPPASTYPAPAQSQSSPPPPPASSSNPFAGMAQWATLPPPPPPPPPPAE